MRLVSAPPFLVFTLADLPGEVWKDIPGYEGRYQASSLGRIKSLPNSRRFTSLMLKQQVHIRTGYLFVNLTSHNGVRWKQTGRWVARLIALAFHGPCPAGCEVCHGDGVCTNNAADNLRWDTSVNNEADKVVHGTANIGSKNPRAKLNEDQVRKIKRALATEHYRSIAARFGVAPNTIKAIKNGGNWSHIHV